MTEKKSFFKEREKPEITDMRIATLDSPNGLIRRILDINPQDEALELGFQIVPAQFFYAGATGAEASRKAYKHGVYQPLSHPRTQQDAIASRRNPLSYRVRDLAFLGKIPEEQVNVLGYSFRPVQGTDRRQRRVPFVWLLEGARLYAYAETMTKGIEVKPYGDSARVSTEGASITVNVPSRTAKKPRYTTKINSFPLVDNAEKRAIVWGMSSTFEEGREPLHSTFNIRYRFMEDPQASNVFTFYPHDIASVWSAIRHFSRRSNRVPWDMDPFAKPSQKEVGLYLRMCNNVVIKDPTLKSKDKRRKLHVAEKSILLARSIGVLGHDQTMFWDSRRDPKRMQDYDWSIPG
ncbi:MAG: hypothetical protein ACP5NS_01625 [Candidatus Pacearchaeota archaeon]